MQKENLLFFSFPSDSNFGKAKVTKSREQNKRIHSFFMPKRCNFAIFIAKLRKNERNAKRKLAFQDITGAIS